jgi:hypothetical protein
MAADFSQLPDMPRTSRNGGYVAVCTLLLLVTALTSSWSKTALREEHRTIASQVERPPLYLPSANHIKLATLGFNNFASDILWFNTINYFGKQLRGSKDYRWLGNMCDLVTRLDPKKGFAYEFCSNMLAWEAHDYKQSISLLDRAVLELPTEWRYHYLRGFTNWYFLDRRDLARDDLVRASKLPAAPAFLASLAGRLMVDGNDVDSAVAFLKDTLSHASDDNARKVLTEKLQRAQISQDLRNLNKLTERYQKEHGQFPGTLEDLVTAQMLRYVPREPFGGRYVLEPQTGKVTNSSGEKGLEFFGKTKETGIYNMENRER